MRRATLGVFAICSLLLVQNAVAENFIVSYLEGQAQVRHGASWINIAIGDVVPSESIIRLAGSRDSSAKRYRLGSHPNQPGHLSCQRYRRCSSLFLFLRSR